MIKQIHIKQNTRPRTWRNEQITNPFLWSQPLYSVLTVMEKLWRAEVHAEIL